MQKKSNLAALVLTGIAAYGYYKYSKMSDEQKKNLTGDLKSKAETWVDKNVPENVKSLLGLPKNEKRATADADMNSSGY